MPLDMAPGGAERGSRAECLLCTCLTASGLGCSQISMNRNVGRAEGSLWWSCVQAGKGGGTLGDQVRRKASLVNYLRVKVSWVCVGLCHVAGCLLACVCWLPSWACALTCAAHDRTSSWAGSAACTLQQLSQDLSLSLVESVLAAPVSS